MEVRRCLVGALALLAAVCAESGSDAQTRSLTILHTNDLQGGLQPDAYYDEPDRGGWARLLHLLQRAQGRDDVLVLDGGDALGPAVLSQVDAGRTAAELLARAGYHAGVVGNHEFGYGLDTLVARARALPFPLLGANLLGPGGEPLFERYVVVERASIRIAVIGLLSPGLLKVINPSRAPGISIFDPQAALRQALSEVADSTDLWVVLAHMPEDEVYALGRLFPQVSLFVCGGFARPQEKGALPHLVELASGVRIVSTPERGPFLGQVQVRLARNAQGWRLASLRSILVPVDGTVPEDSAAAARIAGLVERFARGARQPVGYASEAIGDAPQWVADLVRTQLEAEVGVVNAGTLREHALGGEITRGDLDYLVRFDDALVVVQVTGRQLREMAASSRTRDRAGQRLIFSGFDPVKERVNGRPLNIEETYRAATTGYLAAGGDGYFGGQELREGRWVGLEEALLQHVESNPGMTRWSGLRRGGQGVWKNRLKASGALNRTALNASASRYSGVAFLGGDDAMAWNTLIDDLLAHEAPLGTLSLRFRSSFGQVMSDGHRREAADRLEGEVVFSLQQRQRAPFASLNANSVWTRPAGQERPLTLRGSWGVQLGWGESLKVRLGLGVERDLAAAANTAGLEVVPEYRRGLQRGGSVSSSTKVFWGATEGSQVSIQQYNSLLINLRGNLYVTTDVNIFVHRGTNVQATGLKSEVQVGLGYTWSRKWL